MGYLYKPSESRARINTPCPSPIMGFKQIPQIPVGADLSAFAGCSALPVNLLRQGSNALDSSSPPQGPALSRLREAKDLAADRDRPFASRRRDTG